MKQFVAGISFYLLIFFPSIANGENSGNFNFGKCSRLNIGGIYSGYNFNGTKEAPGFIIQQDYCIKPSPKYGIGVGAGITKYSKFNFIPVYIDLLACSGAKIYGNVQAGYSFGWQNKSEYFNNYSFNGGAFTQIGVGFRFKFIDDFYSCLFIGYNHQLSKITSTIYSDKNLHFNSLVITLGITLDKD
jgi:hypothetical protein